jgi:leucyl/phenylalanyl-tRNA---protein transferase
MRKRLIHLKPADPFPPLAQAHDDLGGLLASGGGLAPARLLDAYSRGIFPWFSEDEPVLWWSPDPRMVLVCADFHVSKSLARHIRTGGLEVTANRAFATVIASCAQPRKGQPGTWILPEMMNAYAQLHAMGYAHSVETWRGGALVGGLYGVAIGRMFYGESMFTRETDASKVALEYLVRALRASDMPMIDCQQQTRHLRSLGARPVARETFAQTLRELAPRIAPAAIRWAG